MGIFYLIRLDILHVSIKSEQIRYLQALVFLVFNIDDYCLPTRT